MSDINIKGLDKAELLQALHAASRPLGMGWLHEKGDLTIEEARQMIAAAGKYLYFDYVTGRVMKVDLSGDTMSGRMYDRDNGEGACAAVVAKLRAKTAVNV